MIKKLVIVVLVFLILFVAVTPVLAGGDKVHGDKAKGPASQNGDCPFGHEDANMFHAGDGPHN